MRLTLEQIQARWTEVGADTQVSAPISSLTREYKHYGPLTEAAHSFVRWAQSPEERVYLGIEPLDNEMRGIAPGELAMMLG